MLLFVLSLAFAGGRGVPVPADVPGLFEEALVAESEIQALVEEARLDQRHFLATCRDTKWTSAKALVEIGRTATINHRHLVEGPERVAEARRVKTVRDQVLKLRDEAQRCALPPSRPWIPEDPDADIWPDRPIARSFEEWQPTGRVTELVVAPR